MLKLARNTCLAACLLGAHAGCHFAWPFQRQQHFAPLPADIDKSQLVQRLNDNISKLIAWRATNVEIHAKGEYGLPMKLSAVIAVESPRNFRLRASSFVGDEADFGSNPEQFWFWMRRGEPKHVFQCRHETVERAQQRMPLPFQPDWLMEALGVIPIDEREVTLERDPQNPRTVKLVSARLSPTGQPLRRVIQVDSSSGLILSHGLYDAAERVFAKATWSGHRRDPQSGVIIPQRIDLDWPASKMSMSLHLGQVEINPTALPPMTWELPEMKGYPALDLGQ